MLRRKKVLGLKKLAEQMTEARASETATEIADAAIHLAASAIDTDADALIALIDDEMPDFEVMG